MKSLTQVVDTRLNLDKKKLFSLAELGDNYKYLVFDTSVFNSYVYNHNPHVVDIKDRMRRYDVEMQSAKMFKDFIDSGGNIFTIKEVCEECLWKKGDYKKKIKQGGRLLTIQQKMGFRRRIGENRRKFEKEIKDVMRLGKNLRKAVSQLIETLTLSDHIIRLDDKERELFNYLNNRYSGFRQEYGLSNTDFLLLLYTGIISFTKGKSALLSNDTGMRRVWENLVIRERFSPEIFSFFTRIGIDSYDKAYPLSSNKQ